MRYKVLLPTSGVGSRLGNLTNFTNKSLVRIGENLRSRTWSRPIRVT
jgi:NDP-sugar pyrophosphorylase family protein